MSNKEIYKMLEKHYIPSTESSTKEMEEQIIDHMVEKELEKERSNTMHIAIKW